MESVFDGIAVWAKNGYHISYAIEQYGNEIDYLVVINDVVNDEQLHKQRCTNLQEGLQEALLYLLKNCNFRK